MRSARPCSQSSASEPKRTCKKAPERVLFACCPPCRRRHSPAGSAARSPSGAKDIGMQPMSASDAASSKIRAGQRAYHKTKSKKGPGICQTLFPGTPGWIRTSGLPLRRRPLYPTELRGHNSAILAQRTAGVNDRRLGNGMMRRGRGAVARGGKSWYDKQTAQRR